MNHLTRSFLLSHLLDARINLPWTNPRILILKDLCTIFLNFFPIATLKNTESLKYFMDFLAKKKRKKRQQGPQSTTLPNTGLNKCRAGLPGGPDTLVRTASLQNGTLQIFPSLSSHKFFHRNSVNTLENSGNLLNIAQSVFHLKVLHWFKFWY